MVAVNHRYHHLLFLSSLHLCSLGTHHFVHLSICPLLIQQAPQGPVRVPLLSILLEKKLVGLVRPVQSVSRLVAGESDAVVGLAQPWVI